MPTKTTKNKQSKFDALWTPEQAQQAATEGWKLCVVVDEGKPVSSAYFMIFDEGPKLKDRKIAERFVIEKAYTGSKLHVGALSAMTVSRQPEGARKK